MSKDLAFSIALGLTTAGVFLFLWSYVHLWFKVDALYEKFCPEDDERETTENNETKTDPP